MRQVYKMTCAFKQEQTLDIMCFLHFNFLYNWAHAQWIKSIIVTTASRNNCLYMLSIDASNNKIGVWDICNYVENDCTESRNNVAWMIIGVLLNHSTCVVVRRVYICGAGGGRAARYDYTPMKVFCQPLFCYMGSMAWCKILLNNLRPPKYYRINPQL